VSVDSWLLSVSWLMSHDLMLHGWNFPYCNFPLRVSYAFCNFLQFPQEKVGIFFLFWQHAFMCKHLYHCSFLILWLLSLSLKKKKIEYSLAIFFFFCWIFYCCLVYKRVLHLNFLYVKGYSACWLENVKKGL